MGENPYAGQGAVLLDIGGDVGALVVAMPASMIGVEIEISPVGGLRHGHHGHHHGHDHGHHHGHDHGHDHGHHHGHDHGHDHRPHVAVVNRPVTDGTLPSLVFPELVEGSYELYGKGEDTVLLTAGITGGQVTFLDWPGELPAA
jgi:hypothetical protein